ncbi:MAG: DegT/DnrJ/EryC1/StrS family aminotransferase [Acidobacteriia bacterium]|nr:DegT/DnrJ/EryC1/StrS family aminotransferase [Terriglobia bacterium]
MPNIPFLDLVTPHRELEAELTAVFQNTLRTAGFIGGPVIEKFEHDFAQFCDAKHCVGLASGTDAVRFALMAAGVEPGESVITVPNTFIATTEGISQAGALPEFVDVDERTYNLDPEKLREYLERHCDKDQESGRPISRRTGRIISAIVPVHLYGQMADMDPILELANSYNLVVIEDACQAHGAEYFSKKDNRWKKAGSIGKAAAFSFYPGKNLGACGEAGAVTTNDAEPAHEVRMLRDHGQSRKYYHEIEGYNGRLDALQAGILQVKLAHLETWNKQRRERADEYKRLFEASGAALPPYEPSWSRAVYHLYVVRTEDRDGMMNHLKEMGIGTGIHYPVPLHLQTAYTSLQYRLGDFPVAEKAAAEVVSLPMFPQLSAKQQAYVAEGILNFTSMAVR